MTTTARPARLLALLVAVLTPALLVACGGGDEDSGSTTATAATSPAPVPLSADLADLAERSRRSVVRVQVRRCERGRGSEGSGVVVGRRLVITAAHVVDQAAGVIVIQGGSGSEAQLVSVDEENGLALVRTQAILLGQVLRFRTDPAPAAGEVAAALGVPIGGRFEAFTATIGEGPGSLTFGETQITGALRISETLDGGLSGGPLLDSGGRAAGVLLVSQSDAEGVAIAVPAAVARPALAALRGSRDASLIDCDRVGAPQPPPTTPTDDGDDGVAPPAIAAIIEHYRRIDAGEFQGAFELMAPGYRSRNPEWPTVREAGSPDIDDPSLRARGIEQTAPDAALIGVSLIAADSKGPDAGLCRLFTGRITMRLIGGAWLYDPSPGFGPQDVDQEDPRCLRVK